MAEGRERVVWAALGVNLAIALLKLAAALAARSSAMLAEAAHSLADTANQVFLLIGMRRSRRPPDATHPFGYGGETYFWSLMVALTLFTLGGGFSIHEGFERIFRRHQGASPLENLRWSYLVLGGSMALEAFSLTVAMRELTRTRRGRSLRETLRETRDPTVLTVLFEDVAALIGLGVALAGILAWRLSGNAVYDGMASIAVGILLGAVAIVLARDAKSLLLGESMTSKDTALIEEIVRARREVCEVVHLRTMHFGPEEAIAALKVRFIADLGTRELEAHINEIEAELRAALPRLRRIYIEPGFKERSA